MKKIFLGIISVFLLNSCKSDDLTGDLVKEYNNGNKSLYFKHYWTYAGVYNSNNSNAMFQNELNLGNGSLNVGDILYFGDTYLLTYLIMYNHEEFSTKDYWYNKDGFLNVLNERSLQNVNGYQSSLQKKFPYLKHQSNDTLLLLDNGVKYYLLRRDSI